MYQTPTGWLGSSLCPFELPSGSHATPDVPLLFIPIQNLPNLSVEFWVVS
jgi:hypothetical protein